MKFKISRELKYQTILNLLQSASATIDTIMATLMTFVNIAFFVGFTNVPLIPSYIVFSIGFYMRLCNSIGANFTRAITSLVNFRVSANRITEFLMLEELDQNQIAHPNDLITAVSIKDFNFEWKKVFSELQILFQSNFGFQTKINYKRMNLLFRI